MKLSEIFDFKNRQRGQIDFWFLFCVIALLAFGLLMVFSASSESARTQFGNAYHFITRQAIFAFLGLIAMFTLMNINYRILGKMSGWILIGVFALLIIVLIVGTSSKGGQRWINLGFFQLQPSELAKLGLVIFLSFSLEKNYTKLQSFTKGLLPYLVLIGVVDALVVLEHHFSATVIITFAAVVVLFVAGAKISHFVTMGIPALAGFAILAVSAEYRLRRVLIFTDPWKDKLGDGWQIINSLYAIGSGGLFGLGLGKSRQKFSYIPEPHNDFIFSILCEELGLLGAMVVIILFIILIWRGIVIATKAPDRFSGFLATGIISLIAIQVILNLAVITSSMPVTGVALPLFSYGGTAMLVTLAEMGIMLNISRYSKT